MVPAQIVAGICCFADAETRMVRLPEAGAARTGQGQPSRADHTDDEAPSDTSWPSVQGNGHSLPQSPCPTSVPRVSLTHGRSVLLVDAAPPTRGHDVRAGTGAALRAPTGLPTCVFRTWPQRPKLHDMPAITWVRVQHAGDPIEPADVTSVVIRPLIAGFGNISGPNYLKSQR